MKKDNALTISLVSIVLFNIFYIIITSFCYNIIILVSGFYKIITKEYYFWITSRPITNSEEVITIITYLLQMTFSYIFLIEFLYIIFNKKYKNLIDKKNIVISLIVGFVIYYLSFIFIKYKAEHYRLFMTLISTEIFSIILLNLVLKIKNSSKYLTNKKE